MKYKIKPEIFSSLVLAGCLLGLGACDSMDNIQWPHVFSGDEVPQNVRDEPRAVEVPPPVANDEPYPRLGDVPSKPKDFTPQTDIDYSKRQMEEDRAMGQSLQQQYEPSGAPALVTPPVAQ